jgi:SAM-dependent methyltransferase
MADDAGEKPNPFTQYYAQLLHQGNMLQDLTRTGTYRHAFLSNKIDFNGKTVLDVGTGTGILAFFAVQAGARKVYAVEASESAVMARLLIEANRFSDKIEVIQSKLEDVTLPEKVDIIISEPIGFLLGKSYGHYFRCQDSCFFTVYDEGYFLEGIGLIVTSSALIRLRAYCKLRHLQFENHGRKSICSCVAFNLRATLYVITSVTK